MNKVEALRIALDVLKSDRDFGSGEWLVKKDKAISAIQEALAQPKPEPVAWFMFDEIGDFHNIWFIEPKDSPMLEEGWFYEPVYDK